MDIYQSDFENAQDQESLKEIKVLQGLLPICSRCMRVKNSEGNREVLGNYFQGRSDVNFNHGICPTCLDRFYPEYR